MVLCGVIRDLHGEFIAVLAENLVRGHVMISNPLTMILLG